MTRARDVSSRGGLTQVVPASITVGGGSGSVSANGTINCSAITSVRINNAFSATYTNYRIALTCTASTASNSWTLMRLSANNVDHSGGEYYGSNTLFTGSTTFYNATTGGTAGRVGLTHTGQLTSYEHVIEAMSPFRAVNSSVTSTGYWNNGSNDGAHYGVFLHNVGLSYDGFSIIPSNGTFTGQIRVYGYNNG